MTDNRGADRTGLSLFESVSHEHQITTLRLLVETPSQTCTVEEVVDEVATQSTDESADADRSERIRTRLYHVDLPKLADLGVVDYDWRSGDIRRTADEAPIRDLLHCWEGLPPTQPPCDSQPSQ